MRDRAELIEAVLDSLPEAVCLLSENIDVVFWNQAAQAITGYAAADLIGLPVPSALRLLLDRSVPCEEAEFGAAHDSGRGFPAHTLHKLGHQTLNIARHLVLRDDFGDRIGEAVLFHPAESLDALPHGKSGEDESIEASQEDLTERLEQLCKDYMEGGLPFGVLWITVDQAHELRRTHGVGAREAMLKKVEHTLAQGLRPTEHMGRWGEDEFLVISHERTQAMLAKHAQVLAGLARTADFRWWGDRIALTVSIGAAQTVSHEALVKLLERTEAAMTRSRNEGGNYITSAPEEKECSPS